MPDPSELKKNAEIFSNICYSNINNGSFDVILPPAEELSRMLRRCGLLSGHGKKALDFSCGEGRNAEYLFRLGYDVKATEVSQEAMMAATRRFEEHAVNIDLHLIDTFNEVILPFNDATFDLIVAWQCLQWLGSKKHFTACLREFHRVLKDNGGIILTMPTDRHRYKRVAIERGESEFQLVDNRRTGGIIYAPNFFTLKKILEEQGFAIDRKMGFAFWDDDFDWSEDLPQSDYNLYVVKCH